MSDLANKPIEEWTEEEWEAEEREMYEDKAYISKLLNGAEKLAEVIRSSQYDAGGVLGTNKEITTYYKKDNEYFAIEEADDDYADVHEPFARDVDYEKIIEELEKTVNHKDTYTDLYSGCYDVMESDCRSFKIVNEQLKNDVQAALENLEGNYEAPQEYDDD